MSIEVKWTQVTKIHCHQKQRKGIFIKISLIGGVDPYQIDTLAAGVVSSGDFPPIDASDIVSYLVLQTSFITTEQFKARKLLESYNQFTSGWVKDIKSHKMHNKCVVTGRVRNI